MRRELWSLNDQSLHLGGRARPSPQKLAGVMSGLLPGCVGSPS